MRSYAQDLINGGRELVDLVHGRDVPEADGLILAHRDNDSLCQVEVHVQDLVRVGPQEGTILLIRLVQDSQTAIHSTTDDLQAIRADLNSADSPLMLSLHEELAEIERPNPQICVLAAGNAECFIY